MKSYQRNAHGRMFESDFLEAASKVHPVVPLLVYGPLIVGILGYTLATHRATVPATIAFFALGWLAWNLAEYVIHRYFFHWEGIGPITRRMHDITHGYHHRYPDDSMRLVMPLGVSIPLGLIVGGSLYLVGRPPVTLPLFAGIVAGYLAYDCIHWATHAVRPRTAWGKALRAHHMAHHFATPEKNFGISHRWVHFVLGTLRKREP